MGQRNLQFRAVALQLPKMFHGPRFHNGKYLYVMKEDFGMGIDLHVMEDFTLGSIYSLHMEARGLEGGGMLEASGDYSDGEGV